jgi:hypothetical protein
MIEEYNLEKTRHACNSLPPIENDFKIIGFRKYVAEKSPDIFEMIVQFNKNVMNHEFGQYYLGASEITQLIHELEELIK